METHAPAKSLDKSRSASGRVPSRAWWRLAAAMSVTPVMRSAPMAALRRAAMTCWGSPDARVLVPLLARHAGR
jgi:hypothetical protein